MNGGFKKLRRHNSYSDKPPNCRRIVFFWRFIFLSNFSQTGSMGDFLRNNIKHLSGLKGI